MKWIKRFLWLLAIGMYARKGMRFPYWEKS